MSKQCFLESIKVWLVLCLKREVEMLLDRHATDDVQISKSKISCAINEALQSP